MQSIPGLAQVTAQYNLNIDNGLPSDRIYYMREDRHGYIWLGTPKGVVQYNGYTPKIYGFEAGLPNDDVWDLYEDKKGRMWTSSIANEIGYIYNNKYYKAVLIPNNKTIYPRDIQQYKDGVMFYSTYVSKGGALCFEKNDTIYTYSLNGLSLRYLLPTAYGTITAIYKDTMFHIYLNDTKVQIVPVCVMKDKSFINTLDRTINFKNYFFSYKINDHLITVFDANKCRGKIINLDTISGTGEKIKLLSFTKGQDDFFYVITDKNVIKIDSLLRCIKITPVHDLVSDNEIDGNKIISLVENNFWGSCIGTTTKGLFIGMGIDTHFQKTPISLQYYNYIGSSATGVAMWWNEQSRSLVQIDSQFRTRHLPGLYNNAIKLVPYNADTSFFFANGQVNIFNNVSDRVVYSYTGYDSISYYVSPSNMAVKGLNDYYILSKRDGLYHYRWLNGRGVSNYIDHDRYNDVFYDRYMQALWAYNNKKILLLYNGRTQIISKYLLDQIGISKIENIITDSFGNVFIKDVNQLIVFNYRTCSAKLLFRNYRLHNSILKIQRNKIILAGSFGVLFCNISSPLGANYPVVYHNIKNAYYSNVYDMQTSYDKILLNTDKGFYKVDIPNDTILDQHTTDRFINNYKFVLTYNDSLYDIKPKDTLLIHPEQENLLFDIIRPLGNGTVKYKYRIKEEGLHYQLLNANELYLPELSAGRYFHLSVIAYDNNWESNEVTLFLYIVPYWWQKTVWIKFFWIVGSLLFILFIFLVVYFTNRIVTNNNIKRNLRLKLELNSVYSQINPHFIFNTLSTALYFIKKGKLPEAQAHISKFSKLLRAYIKVSRNKYITIAEEIENLNNYIELQQARFENRFDYEITVSDTISQTTTFIPSLLLQPIVENAITHGLLPLEENGHLDIHFIKKTNENAVICMIDDNGIGREKARQIKNNSTTKTESYGNILVKDLVKILNKYEKMNIHISYLDKSDPYTGTIVKIVIKNPHYEYPK